jgi:glucose/arabinose dehydrogenase
VPWWGTPDLLWRVTPGAWYGWPDFSGTEPVCQDRFKPPGEPVPPRLLAQYPREVPGPAALLPVHASADGFDVSRNPDFGHVGEAFIALFGDEAPTTGKALGSVGITVVRVNVRTGVRL